MKNCDAVWVGVCENHIQTADGLHVLVATISSRRSYKAQSFQRCSSLLFIREDHFGESRLKQALVMTPVTSPSSVLSVLSCIKLSNFSLSQVVTFLYITFSVRYIFAVVEVRVYLS